MAFHSLHDFLYIGGFAAYVWPAYLLSAVCFVLVYRNTNKENINTINRLKRKYESNS